MKSALEWLKAHKGPAGTVLSMAFIYLQLHPEFATAREILGWLSGVLVGAGYIDRDAVVRAKQEPYLYGRREGD